MKDTRTRTQDERRAARARIVQEEASRLQAAAQQSTGTSDGNGNGNGNDHGDRADNAHDRDELLALLEDMDCVLEAEKRQTDDHLQRLAETFARDVEDDMQNDLAELVKFQETISSPDDVLCPLCCHASLTVCNGRISCACGLCVDCYSNNNVTLTCVRDRLAQVLGEHHHVCAQRLMFQMRHLPRKHLWAGCQVCRYDSVVL